MLGPKNPASPQHWEETCGSCHPYQLRRVRSSLMFTNTGIITGIQKTWESETQEHWATQGMDTYDGQGRSLRLHGVEHLDNLGGELYRKFCSRCHLQKAEYRKYRGSHASGCAACHFPYNANATYQGMDETLQGDWPYSESHALAALPPNEVCLHCHNRSGRIALTYQGLYDGNSALVPTRDARPGPEMMSGGRSVVHIAPDVHFEAGMDCIDCHTSRDIMGDGYAYRHLYRQVEIRCRNCHGTGSSPPRSREIVRENAAPVRESRSYPMQVRPGMRMALTSKGRPYSNVFSSRGSVYVLSKRSGELLQSPVITGTREHTIAGHERLSCPACHSRAVPQCYGCHTTYDRSKLGPDYIKGEMTPGRFSEKEDYRRLYPFPLALDQRGKITPVTPGCQTLVTLIDSSGRTVQKDYVARFKGERQFRFAPFAAHNTGKKPIGCRECHSNPAFFGFGQGIFAAKDRVPLIACEGSPSQPLDGFLSLQNGSLEDFAAITRPGSRALTAGEIKRIFRVNLCLVCHDDPQDPIYQNELDYSMLAECLRRSDTDPYAARNASAPVNGTGKGSKTGP